MPSASGTSRRSTLISSTLRTGKCSDTPTRTVFRNARPISGARLYTLLLELLRLQNVRTAYALVTLPNTKSEALHRHFGFKLCGVWHSSGFKNGRWYDMGSFEKQLLPYEGSPAPLQRLCDVPAERVQSLLRET